MHGIHAIYSSCLQARYCASITAVMQEATSHTSMPCSQQLGALRWHRMQLNVSRACSHY